MIGGDGDGNKDEENVDVGAGENGPEVVGEGRYEVGEGAASRGNRGAKGLGRPLNGTGVGDTAAASSLKSC